MATLARNALTTPARIRMLQAGFGQEPDSRLAFFIDRASGDIVSALDRILRRATYRELVTPSGSQELLLRQWPIVSVEQVLQDGIEISPDRYSIEEGGILYKDDGWLWSGYPRGLAYDPRAARRDVTVLYTAGYVLPKDATDDDPSTLPADLEGLCMEMVTTAIGKMQTGGSAGLKSFGISDVRWEWTTEAPASWQATLDRYKRWA